MSVIFYPNLPILNLNKSKILFSRLFIPQIFICFSKLLGTSLLLEPLLLAVKWNCSLNIHVICKLTLFLYLIWYTEHIRLGKLWAQKYHWKKTVLLRKLSYLENCPTCVLSVLNSYVNTNISV